MNMVSKHKTNNNNINHINTNNSNMSPKKSNHIALMNENQNSKSNNVEAINKTEKVSAEKELLTMKNNSNSEVKTKPSSNSNCNSNTDHNNSKSINSKPNIGFKRVKTVANNITAKAPKKNSSNTNLNSKEMPNGTPRRSHSKQRVSDQETEENSTNSIRKDAKGVPIVKGHKKHRVTFRDFISKQSLIDFINIESFKKDNSIENSTISQEKTEDSDNTSCTCLIY